MVNFISFFFSVFSMLFGTGMQMPALPTTLSSTPTTAIVRTEPQGYTIPPVENKTRTPVLNKVAPQGYNSVETQKIVSLPVQYEAYEWGNPQKKHINGEKEITVNMEGGEKRKIVFVANGSVAGVEYATENKTISVPKEATACIIYSAVGKTSRMAPGEYLGQYAVKGTLAKGESRTVSIRNRDGSIESVSEFIYKMNDEQTITLQMESLTAKGYIDVPSPISEEAVSPFGVSIKASPIDLIVRYEAVGEGAVTVNPVTGVVTAKTSGMGTINCIVSQRVNGEVVTLGTIKATFMVS